MIVNTLYLTTLVDNKTKKTITADKLVSGGSSASEVAHQAQLASDATSAEIVTGFNSLLTAMQTAGIMAVS